MTNPETSHPVEFSFKELREQAHVLNALLVRENTSKQWFEQIQETTFMTSMQEESKPHPGMQFMADYFSGVYRNIYNDHEEMLTADDITDKLETASGKEIENLATFKGLSILMLPELPHSENLSDSMLYKLTQHEDKETYQDMFTDLVRTRDAQEMIRDEYNKLAGQISGLRKKRGRIHALSHGEEQWNTINNAWKITKRDIEETTDEIDERVQDQIKSTDRTLNTFFFFMS